MKKRILVVEDDKFFRFAIRKYVKWDAYDFEIIGEAVHGGVALEFIESNPVDIVLTDMSMPVMDGIALTAAVKEKYPDIMVIVLSAYDDFEFVREALKLGAKDYILKQDMEKEDIGQMVKKSWDQHMAQLAGDIQLRNDIVSFLEGDSSKRRAEKYLRQSLREDRCYYVCIVENRNPDWIQESCRQTIWFEESLFEIYDNSRHVMLIGARRYHGMEKQREDRNQKITDLAQVMKGESYLGGCSSLAKDATELQKAYEEAKRAIETGCFRNKKQIISWDEVADVYRRRKSSFLVDGSEYEGIEDKSGAAEALNDLTDKIRQFMPDELHILQNYLVFINAVAGNLQYDIDKMEYAEIKERISGQVILDEKKEAAADCIRQIFERSGRESMHESVVRSILFMKKNYSQDLSLGEIARYVSLNESYLSNLFKRETGNSITEYLNKIRIEKAKELILQTSLKNYEVAESVGIFNASYFSTLFKKEAGLTVQEYRLKKVEEIQNI